MKRTALIWAAVLLVIGGLAWVVLFPALLDPVKFFDQRRSQSFEVQVNSTWRENGLILSSLHITGRRSAGAAGSSVEFYAYSCQPENENGLLPAFILISGLETGREAIRVISRRPDIARLGAFITLDYPYSGPIYFERLVDMLPHIREIRRSLFDGVEAIRLAIDYLEGLEEVDPHRIILLGVSLGAFFAVDAGAVDSRPAAVMVFMGGGQLRSLLEYNMLRNGFLSSRILSLPISSLAGLLIRPLEPVRLVGRISPRPYIQVSAEDDVMIPEANALALYDAAKDPRSLIWMPAPHLLPGMEGLIEQMIAITGEEMDRWGLF